MATLYKVIPTSFSMINTEYYDPVFGRDPNINFTRAYDPEYKTSCEIRNFIDTKVLSYEIKEPKEGNRFIKSTSKSIIESNSITYSTEKEALIWLFSKLESYGQSHTFLDCNNKNKKVIFNFEFRLPEILRRKKEDNKGVLMNFLNEIKLTKSPKYPEELPSIMYITKDLAPKQINEILVSGAPNAVIAFLKYFDNEAHYKGVIIKEIYENL